MIFASRELIIGDPKTRKVLEQISKGSSQFPGKEEDAEMKGRDSWYSLLPI